MPSLTFLNLLVALPPLLPPPRHPSTAMFTVPPNHLILPFSPKPRTQTVPLMLSIQTPVHPAHSQREAQHFHLTLSATVSKPRQHHPDENNNALCENVVFWILCPYCTSALASAWHIFQIFFFSAGNKRGCGQSRSVWLTRCIDTGMHSEIKGEKKSIRIDAKVTQKRKGNRNVWWAVRRKAEEGYLENGMLFVAQTESINQKQGCKVRVQD